MKFLKSSFSYFSVALLFVLALVCLILPDQARDLVVYFMPDGQGLGPEHLLVGIGMTTLAANSNRAFGTGGHICHYPIIASEIIYEGAAVGLVQGTGHARPLQAGDLFVGFANRKCDNSTGSAADKNVEVRDKGTVQLSVSGAVITDVGQPIYATDDDTFVFSPVGGVFVGKVERFISSGVVDVRFDVNGLRDPYADWTVRELLSGTKTFDAQDTGKAFFVDSDGDGDALTLPAIADGLDNILIVAISGYGTTQVVVSPNASDGIHSADAAATADKDLLLTKATQQRGDCVELNLGDADGMLAKTGNLALGQASTWTKEA